jgi:RNA-splicing ligase RtcB
MDSEVAVLEFLGLLWFFVLIDEIPQAYKDIDEVMENSKEMVHVDHMDHVLRQVVNIKGD